jgi:SAM-dependent methyltransferase
VNSLPADAIAAYDLDAAAHAAIYEVVDSRALLEPWLDHLTGGMALDVGAGSGRDGAFLESIGYKVIAAEPAAGMRREGERRHAGLRWIDDRLPDLSTVHGLGLSYDLILLSAVWMHVRPGDRARAFRKIVTLLKPGGMLLMTLRHGPSPADRPMHPVSLGELEILARDHGLAVLRALDRPDQQGRPDVTWTHVCLRLPDDGSAGLPLIRGVILNDDKSSTYKLGLLRAVAKAADLAPSLARSIDTPDANGDRVAIPMGLIALNWLRAYLPLIKAGLPQSPTNVGAEGLGFVKDGFKQLMALEVTAGDLRIGAMFTGERASALVAALGDARRTIMAMPMRFTTYPNSAEAVFAAMGRPLRPAGAFVVDHAFLRQWGELLIPGGLWRTMLRLGAWVDPVLTAEWARLTRTYGLRAGLDLPPGVVEARMTWQEPSRDVSLARAQAVALQARGGALKCVWSDTRLKLEGLDIDHALPWSAWPCGDLWNLFPSARRINQTEKREKLPSATALAGARNAMLEWWGDTWLSVPALSARFEAEARAALPLQGALSPEAVFAGLEWRRLRLRQDQSAPEWPGVRRSALLDNRAGSGPAPITSSHR